MHRLHAIPLSATYFSTGFQTSTQREPSSDREKEEEHASRLAQGVRNIYQSLTHCSGSQHLLSVIVLLPIELHSLVLNIFLKSETGDISREALPTVHAYAAVCRLWRAAALPYTYRFIRVLSLNSLEKLASIIHGDPSVAHLIQKIRLCANKESHWIYTFPTVLGVPLPALSVLEIFSLRFKASQEVEVQEFSNWIPTLSNIPSLHSLYLESVAIPCDALTSLVCAFPSLTSLSSLQGEFVGGSGESPVDDPNFLIEGRAEKNGSIVYPVLHSPPPLRELKLVSTYLPFGEVQDWLCPRTQTSNLVVLDLWMAEMELLVGLIKVASPRLEYLSLPSQGRSVSTCELLGCLSWR